MAEIIQRCGEISFKHMLKLAGPIFAANLAIVCSGTIDTIMAGQLSADELAGVALGIAVATWISISLAGVLQGVSPIAGFAYGARHLQDVERALTQCLYLAIALTIPGVALTLCTDLWMAISNVTGPVATIATQYLVFAAAALPAILIGRCFIAVNAAVSRPAASMCVTLLMVGLKAPCNMLFIYGWGDWQGFGGAGVGLSTCVLNWGAIVVYWLIWRLDPYYEQMRLKTAVRPDAGEMFKQLKIGVPVGISIFFEMTSYTLMAIFIARTGAVILAAHQIVANLVWLYYVIPFAIGLSGTVLVSQSLGAKQSESARKATFMVMNTALVAALIVSAATWVFREEIAALYTRDVDVQKVAVSFLTVVVFYHIADAVQCAGTCILRGYRITLWPMVAHCVLLCGVGLTIGYCTSGFLEGSRYAWGAIAFWIGAAAGLTTAALFIAPYTLAACNREAGRKWFDFSALKKAQHSY